MWWKRCLGCLFKSKSIENYRFFLSFLDFMWNNINIKTKRNATIAEHHWFCLSCSFFLFTSPQRKFLSSPYHLYFFPWCIGRLPKSSDIWHWAFWPRTAYLNVTNIRPLARSLSVIRYRCAVKFRYMGRNWVHWISSEWT